MKPLLYSVNVLSQRRQYWRGLLVLAVILLLSTACSAPSLSRGPSATAQPTVGGVSPTMAQTSAVPRTTEGSKPVISQAQPTPQEKLPPALVEVDPPPHSVLAPGVSPIFYFNQAMEKHSVEAAFKAQPDLAGQFEWLDDATLRFKPGKPVSTGVAWQVTIGANAKAANGLALAAPVQVSYEAPEPLQLAERLPAPDASEVNPSSAVVVTFTRPVVALGADSASLPPAFTLEPAGQGRGAWLNTSTYIFYPQPALMGGATYTVHLNSSLTTLDGAPLAADAPPSWTFSTSAPQIVAITPAPDQTVTLDSAYTLTFNQPMDTVSVEAGFSFAQASGAAIVGQLSWNSAQTELTFKPDDLLQRGTVYILRVAGSVKSQGGAALGSDFRAAFTSVPQFSITQTQPAAGEAFQAWEGYGSVSLTFSGPAAVGQDFSQLVTFTPALSNVGFYYDPEGFELHISGYFKPSTGYTLTVSPDLQDRWGAKLGAPFTFSFTSQPAVPTLTIPMQAMGASALFVPAGETGLSAQATNINRLNLSRGQLSLREFIQVVASSDDLKNWSTQTSETWQQSLTLKPNVAETINVPLTKNGAPLTPGLYFLKVDSRPAAKGSETDYPLLVVVSPIQIVLKVSTRQAFVWAVRVPENTPVPNALVTLLDSSATTLGSCTTDASGTCQVALPPDDQRYQALFAVHGQPGDADFSLTTSNWNNGISPWDFNLPFEYEGSQPEIYLYTDRPIYRPGQTVNFRLIARAKDNGRYASPDLKTLSVDVISPYDSITQRSQTLTTLRLALDAYGSATGAYTLPADAASGSYSLHVQEVDYNAVNFEVARYRKPEIDLQVTFPQTDALAGKDIQAQVKARYFFGAPAGNLTLLWSLSRTPGYLDLPDNLIMGRMDTSWLQTWAFPISEDVYLTSGQVQTSPDGTATIILPWQDLITQLGDAAKDLQTLKLEVTAEDESGFPVSARATARLLPAPYAIGLRSEQWNGQAGQPLTYYVRTVDWQGNLVADRLLSAHFRKVVWVRSESPDLSQVSDLRPQYTDVSSTDFRTSAEGEARLSFTPADPGTYLIEITSQEGAITQSLSWVGGSGAAAWPDLANQHLFLRSDAKNYQPGQTAHIFIPNPYADGALALVTVERAKVMHSMVIPIQGASYDLQLPLGDEDAPNIYVSVLLLGRNNRRPDFRMGILALDVAPDAQLLKVSVTSSPPQPQPGEEVTLAIQVKDHQNRPVQGEFSLALIDKAVLALADPNSLPIEQAFYGEQPSGVQNSLSLAAYSGRIVASPPGRGGGGGGAASVSTATRSQFADTAYWNAALQTDESGTVQVTLKLPENLTTWRADVRGLTGDTRVGQGTGDLIATRPLVIRPAAPRFVVPGDHICLTAVVNNNTQAELQASARLEVAGFTLDDPNLAVQPVTIAAGGRQAVHWWGTVQDVPALDLTFSVEAMPAGQPALSDAARPELNPVPVLRYTASQSFGTSGVLSTSGEQVELVSLPRSFTPLGGSLSVELSPSLSAAVLDGLKVLEAYPRDFTEPVLSRLLPNLAVMQALKDLNLADDPRRKDLEAAINDSTARLIRIQNEDGGWGWMEGAVSDPYLTSYALVALSRAAQSGAFVDAQVIQKAQDYLTGELTAPTTAMEGWEVDRLAFGYFALQQAGRRDLPLSPLYDLRDKLSPWGKAFLALTLQGQAAGDTRVNTLVSDLAATAQRSSTGASWQDSSPTWHNWSTPNFTTAVVTYALARLTPSSSVLLDAVRYLVLNRQPSGAWASSYESAWSLMALTEAMRATGDAQASYAFSASLNGSPVVDGKVENLTQAANPVSAQVPLAQLNPTYPNALVIRRGEGSGRLYYRAFLQVDRSAEDAQAIDHGLALTRQYYRAGQDCRIQTCQPLDALDLADQQPVQVRLTLTLSRDMNYVVVEDYFPAGTEVLNPRLKTSQQNVVPLPQEGTEQMQPQYDQANPFDQGWGWWLFNDPQVYDDHIRWVVDYLPAGTYELTYRLTPTLAGEFRVIPAHAWEYYFPDVEGSSQGRVITIK